ncbi:MAG: maleylpyruvate isomerase N-terminal domain-containing protein [Nocardioides sp.]
MTSRRDEIAVLSRGLDQAHGLLSETTDQHLVAQTPCEEWKGADLVDHLVASPGRFAQMVRGEEVDWTAETPHVEDDPAGVFRSRADELMQAWEDAGDAEVPMGPDWQTAEIAVHTFDLARTLGRPTTDLDREVAERGLALMQANLTDDQRGDAFAAEKQAPEGADGYQRIAAYAGREV